jgi:hypothetical protein
MKTKSWDRIRFRANEDDYRPVIWPPIGPYWCSGQGNGYSIVVAYMPHGSTDADLKKYWPEASEIDRMSEGTTLTFSDRFAEPDWWKKLQAK